MADRTCEKCGMIFDYPWKLKRHHARKTPCDPILDTQQTADVSNVCRYCGRVFTTTQALSRHTTRRCKIANSAEGMEKLLDHTIRQQLARQRQQFAAQNAKINELAARLEAAEARSLSPHPPDRATPTSADGFGGVRIHQVNNVNNVNLVNTIIVKPVMPWDGGKRISVNAAQIAAAFEENARLREYVRLEEHQLTDPEIAPPYVA